MNVFDRLGDEIICHANDDNYKESYALFKIGDVEELIDNYRYLQFKIDRAIEILNKSQFEYDNIPCNYEEDIQGLKNVLKEDK